MLAELLDRIGNIIFPKRCPCCDEITEDNAKICDECQSLLVKLKLENSCLKCGLPKDECVCKRKVYLFKGIVAPFRYEGSAAAGVLNIKRLKSYENAEFFAGYMAKSVRGKFSDVKFDFICSVPMSRSKEKETDFNHTKVLAKYLSKELNLPYFNILQQIKENESQHNLDFESRAKNVKGIYRVKDKYKDAVWDKKILLVDDIKTSGATLNESAHEILLQGADEVWCVTAAVTTKKHL